MRLLILLGILIAFDLYAFQALRTLSHSWTTLWRNLSWLFYWLVPVALLVTILLYRNTDFPDQHKHIFTIVRTLLFMAYISKLLILPPLLIDDLRRLGTIAWQFMSGSSESYNTGRSRFLSQFGLLLGSVPFLTLSYGMIRNPYRYKLFTEKVKLPKLPDALRGLRIVQISDIHSGSFTFVDPVRDAIEMVNRAKPDLVFFTGDMVNNKAEEMEPFIEVFNKIEAQYGVYSVLGNHDYGDYVQWPDEQAKAANFERLKAIHAEMGWDLLLNEHRQVEVNGEKVAVIGVENYSASERFPKHGDLEHAHRDSNEASLKLLLSHDPSHWEKEVLAYFSDIDITFSGHTHGMQFGVEIPGWIKWSPIKYVYKQWAGLYQRDHQFLYVNRGLGFIGYPGRVGILPEITLLELDKA